ATPTPSQSSTAGANDQQYRRWMQEARDLHPYQESVDTMWAVMLCESGGDPTAQGASGLTGLFQYQPSTWSDAWNPYRDQPITDARAQIFATAKAWSDGYQSWWEVCFP
nr:transglycosylase family protein [Herpetosiphon sp.]